MHLLFKGKHSRAISELNFKGKCHNVRHDLILLLLNRGEAHKILASISISKGKDTFYGQ